MFPPRSKLDIRGHARGHHGEVVDGRSSVTGVGDALHEPVDAVLWHPPRIIRVTRPPSEAVHENLGRDSVGKGSAEQRGDKTPIADAEKRSTRGPNRVATGHGVLHPTVDRRGRSVAKWVREPKAAGVEPNHAATGH